MTVIAWDGKSIAADRRTTMGNFRITSAKLIRLPNGEILAGAGNEAAEIVLREWYVAGADPKTWTPRNEETDNSATLAIVRVDGCYYVDNINHGHVMKVLDKIMAWGSGMNLALGAMEMGATAEQACDIASRWNTSCGDGVDVMQYEAPGPRVPAMPPSTGREVDWALAP